MLPITTNLAVEETPRATYVLVAANILIHLILTWNTNLVLTDPMVKRLGFVPAYIPDLNPAALSTLFTSMFLHGDLMHLFGNMLFLLVFGRKVETQLGWKNYAAFYLICGITASMTHTLIDPESSEPLIGASGAVSGILGAFLVYNPKARITLIPDLILIYLLRRLVIRLPAWFFLAIWFWIQVYLSMNPHGSNVAFWAHIGGFTMGATLAVATYKYIPKEKFYSRRENFRD